MMNNAKTSAPLYRVTIDEWCRKVDALPSLNAPLAGPVYVEAAPPEIRRQVPALTMAQQEAYAIVEEEPPITMARLPRAVIDSTGAVYPAPGVVFYDELSMWPVLADDPLDRNAPSKTMLEASKDVDQAWSMGEVERISGPAVVLGQISRDNFNSWYHFLIEFLPRFMVLEGFNELADVPVIMPFPLTAMHRQIFHIMGIDSDRFLTMPENGVCVEDAYIPSFTGPWSGITKRASDWILNGFSSALAAPCEIAEKIYITRGTGAKRQVSNEGELTALLEKVGFRVVAPGEMPVAEQARTLSKAIFVVGVHGAAMTNLLFCPPDCRVIELYHSCKGKPKFTSSLLQSLSSVRGLHHGVLHGDSLDPEENFRVDPGELMRFLQMIANYDPSQPFDAQGFRNVRLLRRSALKDFLEKMKD